MQCMVSYDVLDNKFQLVFRAKATLNLYHIN